jgi:hypothetical protein
MSIFTGVTLVFSCVFVSETYPPVLFATKEKRDHEKTEERRTDRYRMSVSIGCLNYIAPCCGYVVGAIVCSVVVDRLYNFLAASNTRRQCDNNTCE